MTADPDGRLQKDGAQALRRWKLGHHLFHVQLTVMGTLLAEARGLVLAADWDRLSRTLDQLTDLYDAATASMKFAADFDRSLYEEVVRPSMSPPHVRPGFSGTLNQEHELMLVRLRDLRSLVRPTLRRDELPLQVREGIDRLSLAQARNQRHHMLICESFVPDGVSLLRQHLSHDD